MTACLRFILAVASFVIDGHKARLQARSVCILLNGEVAHI